MCSGVLANRRNMSFGTWDTNLYFFFENLVISSFFVVLETFKQVCFRGLSVQTCIFFWSMKCLSAFFKIFTTWGHANPKNPLLNILGKAFKITRQTHFSTTKIQEDIEDAKQSIWTENIWLNFVLLNTKLQLHYYSNKTNQCISKGGQILELNSQCFIKLYRWMIAFFLQNWNIDCAFITFIS